jgi:hypothetical protein
LPGILQALLRLVMHFVCWNLPGLVMASDANVIAHYGLVICL